MLKRKFYEDNEDFVYIYEKKPRWSAYLKRSDDAINGFDIRRDFEAAQKCYESAKVPGLFEICLELVVRNIEMVENFFDFPEQIGEIIFDKCVELRKFDYLFEVEVEEKTKNCALDLFTTAYPGLVLTSVCIVNNFKFLSNMAKPLSCCVLQKINLSGCKLNLFMHKCDESLLCLLRNSCDSLQVLNLSCNNLNDDSIQKLTLPQRITVVDFKALEKIDLSGNRGINFISLKFFLRFSSLSEIRIDVDIGKAFEFKIFLKDFKFKLCTCNKNPFEIIFNVGWSTRLFEDPLSKSKILKLQDQGSESYHCIRESIMKSQSQKEIGSSIKFYQKNSHDKENTEEINYKTFILKAKCDCFKVSSKENDSKLQNEIINKSCTNIDGKSKKSHSSVIICKKAADELKALYASY